jgi:multiple sugar transport system substrate-binding protein
MKCVVGAILFILIVLSTVAWVWQPEDPDDRIELVWVTGDSSVTRAHAELFNAQNDRYRVRLDPMNGQLEKVIVQTIAGVGPDLFDVHTSGALAAFVQTGVAMDVTDALHARGITAEAMWPCLEPLYTFNHRMYGLPPNTHAPAIWFNKDHFDEAGLPYPTGDWTWNEFIEVAQRLTKADANGRPERFGFMGPLDAMLYYPLLRQWNAGLYNEEGTRCTLDSPEAIAAFQFGQDLLYKYKVMPTPSDELSMATSGGWGQGAMTLFGNGRGSMAVGGRWWLIRLRDESFRHLRLGAVELPRGPVDRNFGSGRAVIVNAKTPHVEGCLEFLEFMQSPIYNDFISRVAEGVPPVKEYSYSDLFLNNPEYPQEDFHEVWRHAVELAEPMETSIYANGLAVEQMLVKQVDMIKFNLKTAEQAMTDAASEINASVVERLRTDLTLHESYKAALARGAQPAWDRPEDAPW